MEGAKDLFIRGAEAIMIITLYEGCIYSIFKPALIDPLLTCCQ